jgi:hypothetical protein
LRAVIARRLLALVFALALVAPASAAAQDPADQPPFGGEEVPPLVGHTGKAPIPGFELTAAQASGIARRTKEVRDFAAFGAPGYSSDFRRLDITAATRGNDLWEVRVRDHGKDQVKILVVIDDSTGQVEGVFTGEQIDTKLARGYEGAVAGNLNKWWFWIPMCLLFLAPFIDFRRAPELLQFDLVALLGFSASLFFFNRAEIGLSSVLVYPVLAYLFVRMLFAGFRPSESRDRLLPHAKRSWLVAGIVALVALHTAFTITEGKVIDVGVAGVIGADRLTDGEDIYSEDFSAGLPLSGDVRGDVYGPVNYMAYVPFELAFPWHGKWDDVPAARSASLAFTLLTALGLFALGRRLRAGEEGRTLGVALAFAWLAYPFTLYTLGSSFNDSLVALGVVCCMLVLSSPPARGAATAFFGLTKFGSLALAPLFAAGTGERRPRTLILFSVAFALVAIAVTLPVIPDGGLSEMYDRSLGYQASRGSPFSIWGQAPALDPLQTASKVFAVGLAAAVFFVPKRRTPVQVAALGAAVLIAVEVTASHWFYPYAVWFAPLVLVALFAAQRGPEPGATRP